MIVPKKKKKNGRPTNRSRSGRKTVMTESAISKLVYAFALGMNDRDACLYAAVSVTSLFRYCDENPSFREQKEALKINPVLKALAARDELVKANEWSAVQDVLNRHYGKPKEFKEITSTVNVTKGINDFYATVVETSVLDEYDDTASDTESST